MDIFGLESTVFSVEPNFFLPWNFAENNIKEPSQSGTKTEPSFFRQKIGFPPKTVLATTNYLNNSLWKYERQSCCKFPATFVKPVTSGKTALFHATFTSTMRLLGFAFHARSIFTVCARSAQHV
jgi:hypothetical protein